MFLLFIESCVFVVSGVFFDICVVFMSIYRTIWFPFIESFVFALVMTIRIHFLSGLVAKLGNGSRAGGWEARSGNGDRAVRNVRPLGEGGRKARTGKGNIMIWKWKPPRRGRAGCKVREW